MMDSASAQHHVVGSMRMDFRLTDKSLGRSLQEILSRLANRKLMPAMEAVFSAACTARRTHRLERLVVDLGVLPLAHLEEEILARFTPRLKQALADALHSRPEPEEEHPITALFEHLLKTGTLPWWAGEHSGVCLEDLFMELGRSDPSFVVQVVRNLGTRQQVRLRLIRQFSATALAALVGLLEPADAAMILQCSEHLSRLHEKSPVVTASPREFHEARWDLMLQTLLEERGTRFNTKSFLRSNVAGLAQRFGTDYTTLIHHLAEPPPQSRDSEKISLIETLLRELRDEAAMAHPPATIERPATLPPTPHEEQDASHWDEQAKQGADDPALLAQLLLRYFESGAVSSGMHLAGAWQRQSLAWQTSLWEAVLFRSRAVDVAERLVKLFPPDTWEHVQQTFPHALNARMLQYLEAALTPLHPASIDGGWRTAWWQEVFARVLQRRGAGQVWSELLQAGLPQDMSRAEAKILLQSAMSSHPLLRRALAQLTTRSVAAEMAASVRQDSPELLELFDQWLHGADLPPVFPGGAEAWFVRLELHYPSALRALLRKLSGSSHWHRLATRTEPGLRRRILVLLAPRTGPLLWAALGEISRHRAMLFGSRVSDRHFEAHCWEVMTAALLSSRAEPPVHATMQALRKSLDEMARSFGVTSQQLDHQFLALTNTLPAAAAAVLHDPSGWLQAWRALIGPGQGRHPLDALWADGAHASTTAGRQKQLLAALSKRSVMESVVASGGEDFLLWVATQQPAHWRTELSAWLDLLEKQGAARQWRMRALQEIIRWRQQERPRMTSARAFVLQLLRRLGISGQSLPQSLARVTRRADGFSPGLEGRLKLWRSLLSATASRRSITALWASEGRDPRYFYRELLEAAAPDWHGVQRILDVGGGSFFLWLAVGESESWRADFTAWLTFIAQVSAAVGLLPFVEREWRARALHELFQLDRQTTAHALHPGTVMLEVLRRLGVPSHAGRAKLLSARGRHKVPARIAAFLRRTDWQNAPSAPRKPKALNPAAPQPVEPGESFYVDNAGLVILSPFFSMLHEKQGLLEEGRFRDHVAAERAVHLLHALLTDETAVAEQSLVLNKVLCGLSPAAPVSRITSPAEIDRTHTQALLHSAIQNWPVLGGVSIEGFRSSFLMRRGKLIRGEERWTLTIEHRGLDVLMSSLPWSFAVIKPLWMPDPLYVDWV